MSDAGTIVFENAVQLALWKYILTGQMSDGQWEDTPGWETWAYADALIGAPAGIDFEPEPWYNDDDPEDEGTVTYYEFGELYDLEDRMTFVANLAKLVPALFESVYYPPTGMWEWVMSVEHEREQGRDVRLNEWRRCGITGDIIATARNHEIVTRDEMWREIAHIERIMKTVRHAPPI